MENSIVWYRIGPHPDFDAPEFSNNIEYELIPSNFPRHVFIGHIAYCSCYRIFLTCRTRNHLSDSVSGPTHGPSLAFEFAVTGNRHHAAVDIAPTANGLATTLGNHPGV